MPLLETATEARAAAAALPCASELPTPSDEPCCGDIDGAVLLRRRGLRPTGAATRELKRLGAEHPDVGGSYFNIGAIYANLKRGFLGKHKKADKETAMEYLLRAKAIYLKKLGPQHPNTKNVQWWIDSLK